MGELNRQRQDLAKQERELILEDLSKMINKCFVRRIPRPDGTVLSEYVCINGYPMVRNFKTGESFNEYQLPAIHFYIGDKFFVPYENNEEGYGHPVFWFDTVFTGELPEEYCRGAHNSCRNTPFVECDRSEYITAMEKRFAQFKANLFEPTTPAL